MEHKYLPTISSENYKELEKSLKSYRSFKALKNNIVNSPFEDRILSANIDLGIVVLLQVSTKNKTINRVALSETELAEKAVQVSAEEFHKIKIPLEDKNNLIARVIKNKKLKKTDDWTSLFTPVLTPQQAKLNQTNAGIECSVVYPLLSGDGGALIFSFYQPQVSEEHMNFVAAYSRLVDDELTQYFKNKK